MTTWREFAQQVPEIAAFGALRYRSGVAYLGTLRADGGPRVHPVTPIIGDELYLFMEPTSPKGKDLQRDGRYTLHCSVENADGGGGEFYVRGLAALVTDPAARAKATAAASYTPQDRYILFRLSVEYAAMKTYGEGPSRTRHWSAGE